jgi:hypothetical protein
MTIDTSRYRENLARLPLAFPSLVTIEIPTISRDLEGGEDDTGGRTVRYADVPCQFADTGATFTDENRVITGTFEDSYRSVFLLGDWAIELSDVLVHDAEEWDIRAVRRDDWAIVTHLEIEKRNP